MYRIVSGIITHQQHIETLHSTPEVYRPPRCPGCGLAGLWRHGCYSRKANRRPAFDDECLNPIPIPRFRCPGCWRTCSRLPSCIPPRRWHSWLLQQQVLQCLLAGCSFHRCAAMFGLCRHTVRRWRNWLESRTPEFEFILRSRLAEWGRAANWKSFWTGCLSCTPLSEVMAWLDFDGLDIP